MGLIPLTTRSIILVCIILQSRAKVAKLGALYNVLFAEELADSSVKCNGMANAVIELRSRTCPVLLLLASFMAS